jgi:hypothetical protein
VTEGRAAYPSEFAVALPTTVEPSRTVIDAPAGKFQTEALTASVGESDVGEKVKPRLPGFGFDTKNAEGKLETDEEGEVVMVTALEPPGAVIALARLAVTLNAPLEETVTAAWMVPTAPAVIELEAIVELAVNPRPEIASAEPTAPLMTNGETEIVGTIVIEESDVRPTTIDPAGPEVS